ncbi:MAG: hypothetical protein N3G20_06895, partial [Verrucomicrobiae bacterium]|nr:hypothetical protein [Verrucomicrobiae bacterium]
SQLGVPAKLAFARRINTLITPTTSAATNTPATPSGNVVSTDTGEIVWDLSVPDQGLVTINTPRTKAIVGWCTNKTVNLGELTISPGTNMLGWCTIGATLMNGSSFTNECTALLIATGWWENTGQVWKSPDKNSLTSFGRAPVLTEVIPFTLSLPVGTNRVRVWSLDERGQRKAPILIMGTLTNSVITVTTNTTTIWYELEVSPLTGYSKWKALNFTPAELMNPAISGESASPAGDGVPNLVKYFLGLPPKTPAPADRLPVGELVLIGGQSFLAMRFMRDKMATDLSWEGQIASAIDDWQSECVSAVVHSVEDAGQFERITLRDPQPVTNHQKRFLRLMLFKSR